MLHRGRHCSSSNGSEDIPISKLSMQRTNQPLASQSRPAIMLFQPPHYFCKHAAIFRETCHSIHLCFQQCSNVFRLHLDGCVFCSCGCSNSNTTIVVVPGIAAGTYMVRYRVASGCHGVTNMKVSGPIVQSAVMVLSVHYTVLPWLFDTVHLLLLAWGRAQPIAVDAIDCRTF